MPAQLPSFWSAQRGKDELLAPSQSRLWLPDRGKLLGLMAIHLIFLAANKVRPDLEGTVDILSDCLGALEKVSDLLPNRIPKRCQQSGILKKTSWSTAAA